MEFSQAIYTDESREYYYLEKALSTKKQFFCPDGTFCTIDGVEHSETTITKSPNQLYDDFDYALEEPFDARDDPLDEALDASNEKK